MSLFPIVRQRVYSLNINSRICNRTDILVFGICVYRREVEFTSTHLKATQ